MNVELGVIYRAPVDYNDPSHELTAAQADKEAEYCVERDGKFRPVLVLAYEKDSGRVIAVPLYSLKERARVQGLYEKQKQEVQSGKRLFTSFVMIPTAEVNKRVKNRVQEAGLAKNSIACVDEMRALSTEVLIGPLGELHTHRHLLVLACYIQMVNGQKLQAALKLFKASS